MARKSLIGMALVMAASLAGCGVGPGLTGNDSGGIVPWSPENQAVVRDWAAEHCAYYGKVAHLQPITRRYGQYISFTCSFPRRGQYGYAYHR
jgi:hypothetical protein